MWFKPTPKRASTLKCARMGCQNTPRNRYLAEHVPGPPTFHGEKFSGITLSIKYAVEKQNGGTSFITPILCDDCVRRIIVETAKRYETDEGETK